MNPALALAIAWPIAAVVMVVAIAIAWTICFFRGTKQTFTVSSDSARPLIVPPQIAPPSAYDD